MQAFGDLLGALGSLLGASWSLLGASWEPLGSFWTPRLPQELPRSAQEASKRRPRGAQEASKRPQEAPKRRPRGPQEPPRGLLGSPLEYIFSQIIDCKINVVFYTVFDIICCIFLNLLYRILVWFTDPLPVAINFVARRCDMRFVSYFTSRKACRSLR